MLVDYLFLLSLNQLSDGEYRDSFILLLPMRKLEILARERDSAH